jgi:cell wall assembly regulator SMI1
MPKHARVIGTTEEALVRAEQELGRPLPQSFREWLRANNGLELGSVSVFPVLDDRDPRKTWDSIVRQAGQFQSYARDIGVSYDARQAFLPFAAFGTGDYYCFNYGQNGSTQEPAAVLWSHDDGSTLPRGDSFTDFTLRLLNDEFADD